MKLKFLSMLVFVLLAQAVNAEPTRPETDQYLTCSAWALSALLIAKQAKHDEVTTDSLVQYLYHSDLPPINGLAQKAALFIKTDDETRMTKERNKEVMRELVNLCLGD